MNNCIKTQAGTCLFQWQHCAPGGVEKIILQIPAELFAGASALQFCNASTQRNFDMVAPLSFTNDNGNGSRRN